MDKDAILKLLAKYGNAGLEHIGRPSAGLRSGIEALQKAENPLGPIKEGFMNPGEAPSGADIVENMNLSDKQVALKTFLATANDMADPLALLGLGGAAKATQAVRRSVNPLKMAASSGNEFIDAMNAAKKANPNIKPFVTDYPADEMSKFKNFLSPDKASGVSIKPNGDMINVFSSTKGRGKSLVDKAILEGARKGDNFDQPVLNKLYESKGMKEVDRLKFDDKYAPKDWDYEKLGRPDIIMREMPQEGKIEALKRIIKRNL